MGGGDKTLLDLGGKPMLAHIIDRLEPQVSRVILNANGDRERFSAFPLPVVPDTIDGYAGPLAGILAALQWTRSNCPEAVHVATIAGDTPFFPETLVARLQDATHGEPVIAMASSSARLHPVAGLWPVALAADLAAWLRSGETGKVLAWAESHNSVEVAFDLLPSGHDPFFNTNTPEDLATARTLLEEVSQ